MTGTLVIIAVMLLLGTALTHAQSPGTTYPSEKVVYTDTTSNKPVWRMTVDGAQSGATNQIRDATGMEANSWSPDGAKICYTKTGHPTKPNGYYVMDIQSGVETYVASGFEQVNFSAENTRYGACEFSKSSNELFYFYYFMGDGSPNSWLEIRAVNLSTYAFRVLKRFPKANVCAGGLLQNKDGTYIAVAICTEPEPNRVQHEVLLKPDGTEHANWRFDPASPDAKPFNFNYWHPTNSKVLRASRDYVSAIWNIDTLVQVINPAIIKVGKPNDIKLPFGHASWTMNGATFFYFGGAHADCHPLDIETGTDTRLGYDRREAGHRNIYLVSISEVMSTFPNIPDSYIVARHFSNMNSSLDAAHYGHPHPHFSRDGNYLLFQSNCLALDQGIPPSGAGKSLLTVDLFIVPLADAPTRMRTTVDDPRKARASD